MSVIALLLAQAAAPQSGDPVPSDPPSIEIFAEIRADKLQIEREGEVNVRLEGHPIADKDQRTERNRDKGRTSYSDLVISTHAYVVLADPLSTLLDVSQTDSHSGAAAQSGAIQADQADQEMMQSKTTRTGNDEP